jgi:hypothetical protein
MSSINLLIESIHLALLPASQWRDLAQNCVHHYFNTVNNNNNNNDHAGDGTTTTTTTAKTMPGYVVLHARIETEMMVHQCGIGMENNLTTILTMVEDFVTTFNNEEIPQPPPQEHFNRSQQQKIFGTLVAIGREGLKVVVGQPLVDEMARYNWEVLNERSLSSNNNSTVLSQSKPSTSTSTSTSTLPIFECGDLWVEKAYLADNGDDDDDTIEKTDHEKLSIHGHDHHNQNKERPQRHDYGDIIPSMINYWLAVEATVFVGVAKSSWSTDVWAARYYKGKGNMNYQYTKEDGVIPVPNNGMPTAHKAC